MIRAVIFDLDGTLVRTERLKAISYGRATDELQPSVDHELGVTPAECIVIEDSPSGARSAPAARMRCIAVSSECVFRRKPNTDSA